MARTQAGVLPRTLLGRSHEKRLLHVSPLLVATTELDVEGVYAKLNSRPAGLTGAEAATRLGKYGQNILARDQRPGFFRLLWRAVRNPLVVLLAVLAGVSFATGDSPSATMMLVMIALSVGLKLFQETRASNAAAVWGGIAPAYLAGASDRGLAASAHADWTFEAGAATLRTALNTDPYKLPSKARFARVPGSWLDKQQGF